MTPMMMTRLLPSNSLRATAFLSPQSAIRTHGIPHRTFSSSESEILLERLHNENVPNGSISTLTLNRPKANAMGKTMIQQLNDSIHALEHDSETRCVVITSSSPKVFSAGADLKERAGMTQDEAEKFVTKLRTTMDRMARLPMPTIAAVEGVALGGGLELALAADLRIGSKNAVVGLPETTLAILPGAGGTQRLRDLLEWLAPKELIFTGRRIDAMTAHEYGILQHVVDEGQAEGKAIEMAWEIAKNGPVGIRAAKDAIDKGLEAPDMVNALFIERRCYQRTLSTEDRLEGLSAFKDGRTPEYKGK